MPYIIFPHRLQFSPFERWPFRPVETSRAQAIASHSDSRSLHPTISLFTGGAPRTFVYFLWARILTATGNRLPDVSQPSVPSTSSFTEFGQAFPIALAKSTCRRFLLRYSCRPENSEVNQYINGSKSIKGSVTNQCINILFISSIYEPINPY